MAPPCLRWPATRCTTRVRASWSAVSELPGSLAASPRKGTVDLTDESIGDRFAKASSWAALIGADRSGIGRPPKPSINTPPVPGCTDDVAPQPAASIDGTRCSSACSAAFSASARSCTRMQFVRELISW